MDIFDFSDFFDFQADVPLKIKCPAEVYKPSTRSYRGIGELSYPFHDRTALVTYCGRICIFKKKISLSTSLAGQTVGIKEVDEGIWLESFMDYDLGYIDMLKMRLNLNLASVGRCCRHIKESSGGQPVRKKQMVGTGPCRPQPIGFGCVVWSEDRDFFGTWIAVWATNRIEILLKRAG